MMKQTTQSLFALILLLTATSVSFAKSVELAEGVIYTNASQLSENENQGNVGKIEFDNFVLVIDPQHISPETIRKRAKDSNKSIYLFSTQSPIYFMQDNASEWNKVFELTNVFLITQKINQNLVDVETDLENPSNQLASQISFDRELTLKDDKQTVKLIRYGHGLTPDDSVVYLPNEKILFAGALLPNNNKHTMRTANTENWVALLEELQYLSPKTVVPRYGQAGDATLLETQKDYLTKVRTAVQNGLDQDASVDDIVTNTDIDFSAWEASQEHIQEVYDEITGFKTPWTLREVKLWAGPSFTKDTPGWKPPKKILLSGASKEELEQLQRLAPNVEFVTVRNLLESGDHLSEADALVGRIGKEEFQTAENLRWVHSNSAGVESYLFPEFINSDVVLTNGQGVKGPAIADHVMGLALMLTKGLTKTYRNNLEGQWRRGVTEGNIELQNKTMLVLGLGGIGREVARRAYGFNMRVLAVDPAPMETPSFVSKIFPPDEMKSILPKADVIAVCVPLTKHTYQYIDKECFELMKPASVLVNIARGKVIHQEHLVEALREGKIGGAALDVTDPEPLPEGHPLWSMDNVIITPHVAAQTEGSSVRTWHLLRENVRRFVDGEELLNVVNKQKGY